MKRPSRIVALLVTLLAIFAVRDGYAQSTVVSDCSNDAQLRAALSTMQSGTGGTITFNCGSTPITIVSTTFLGGTYNNVTINGGGRITLSGGNATHLFEVADTGALTLRNLRITRALNATEGGAIYAVGALVIDNVTFDSNRSSGGDGGAIWSTGGLTIRNSRFVNNEAATGGAILASSPNTITIESSTFDNNRASSSLGYGGALLAGGTGAIKVVNSVFTDNTSTYGAGIYAAGSGTLEVERSTFANNTTQFGGSAILSQRPVTLRQSLIVGNSASAMGTGGALYAQVEATIINSTFHGNVGPGVELGGSSSVSIINSTIAHGRSGGFQGGYGILAGAGTVNLKNTILVGNAPNCQIYGGAVLASQGFNISSDGTCALTATGDLVSTDPLLAPLGNFGGPTLSMQPLSGSPAIDNGQCDVFVPVDQRGMTRPAGDACDIGAVEVGWTTWLAMVRK